MTLIIVILLAIPVALYLAPHLVYWDYERKRDAYSRHMLSPASNWDQQTSTILYNRWQRARRRLDLVEGNDRNCQR